MNRVALFITYRTLPGERDAYHRAFDEIARPRIEENPEVELFVRCDDDADDRAVHLFELYRDRAALDNALLELGTTLSPIDSSIAFEAGLRWKRYRAAGGPRNRIIADSFLSAPTRWRSQMSS